MNVTPHDILDRLKENKWNIVVSIAIVAALLVMVMGIRHAATQVSTVIPDPPSSTSSTVSPAVAELSKTLSTQQHQPTSTDTEHPASEGMTNTEQRLSAIMSRRKNSNGVAKTRAVVRSETPPQSRPAHGAIND